MFYIQCPPSCIRVLLGLPVSRGACTSSCSLGDLLLDVSPLTIGVALVYFVMQAPLLMAAFGAPLCCAVVMSASAIDSVAEKDHIRVGLTIFLRRTQTQTYTLNVIVYVGRRH